MRRILFSTAAIASLLLCVFFIYACLRSFLPTHVHAESIDGAVTLLFWEGEIDAQPESQTFHPDSERFAGTRFILSNMSKKSEARFLGFASIRGGGLFRGVSYHFIAIPYWVLIPAAAILPILWIRNSRRQRNRAKAGHCLACGYDLRESKDQCPECGAAIEAKTP